ncbi:hypothetical protein XM47_18055 [Catenovulum maritimum]|uniref:Uncharacterized protein n=1 Tax=Catenovulum maritimum TaxID=1513271 RepID=A0A0J8GLN7_9ALTE|nr:hypothetical protein XM47_18055 [Catenovulum maritimum]
MSNLLFKEKLVVLVCRGASFSLLGRGWYSFLNSQTDLNHLVISTGVSITLFATGFIPKIFFIPLKSALAVIQSPY